MKRLIPLTYVLLLLGLILAPIDRAAAQERSEEKVRTTIEIKNGKVFLNGQEVAELEDADLPVVFKNMKDGGQGQLWFSGDDEVEVRNEFVLHRGPADGDYRMRSAPGAYRFMSRDGEDVEFFDVERFAESMRDNHAAQRFNIEVMADRLGERIVNVESAPHLGLHSMTTRSMSEEVREADRRSRELARMIRQEDGDVDELEAELDEILGLVFNEKQNAQQERIDEMREKLAELEERLTQRQNDREDIIQKRKNELLGRSSRYDW